MKLTKTILVTCIVTSIFLLQTANATFITNGLFAEIGSILETDRNNVVRNGDHVDIEVLEKPFVKKYTKNKLYSSIVNKLKQHGYTAEVYNYLEYEEGELMKYPFRITQTYFFENKNDYDVTLNAGYFPLSSYYGYPNTYNNHVFITERYGILHPSLTVNGVAVPFHNKYEIHKSGNRIPSLTDGTYQYKIQQKWKSKFDIKAGEKVEVKISFYAIDISKNNNSKGSYQFSGHGGLEQIPESNNHTIHVPKSKSVQLNGDKLIEGPFSGDIFMNYFDKLEILK